MITSICEGCGDEFAGARHEEFCPECQKYGVRTISTKIAPPKVRKDDDIQDRLRKRKLGKLKRDAKRNALQETLS